MSIADILRGILCAQIDITISLGVGLIVSSIESGEFGLFLKWILKSGFFNKFGKVFLIILYALISPFWVTVEALWLAMTYKKDEVKCNNCGKRFCVKTAEKSPAITGVAKCPHCGEFTVIDEGETK